MIYLWHGAFDETSEEFSGVETLADFIAELRVTQIVKSFGSEEWPEAQPSDDYRAEPFVAIGYSNGFHRAVEFVDKICMQFDLFSAQIHLIGIDGVRRGGGFIAPKFHLAQEVKSCLYFLRDQQIMAPPWHQMIDRDEPPKFETRRVQGTNHGSIIKSLEVRDSVCQRILSIFRNEV